MRRRSEEAREWAAYVAAHLVIELVPVLVVHLLDARRDRLAARPSASVSGESFAAYVAHRRGGMS